jgi:hypothetical protein
MPTSTRSRVPDLVSMKEGELAAQAALGVLVALGVVGVLAGVQGGVEQRPAQVSGPCLEIGPRASTAPDCLTLGHRPV